MPTEAEIAALQAQALMDSLNVIVPKAITKVATGHEVGDDGAWRIHVDHVDDLTSEIAQGLIGLGYQR